MIEILIPITIIVATKNEEKNIADCLSRLKKFNEIIVVDSNSDDATVAIANDFGATIYDFLWNGDMPKKRQWILENVPIRNDWIFFLDADERMREPLINELNDFILRGDLVEFSAGQVVLQTIYCGKALKFGFKTKGIKLLRYKECSFDAIDDSLAPGLGEMEGHFQPSYQGRLYKLHNMLDHDDVDELSKWFTRHINYARWDAWVNSSVQTKKIINSKKAGRAKFFHNLPGRPITFFFYSYFWKLGFLDGLSGLRYALSYSWYYWLCFLIKQDSKRTNRF